MRKQHDPWEGFPYDRLNEIHITSVKATGSSFEVRSEAAPAYDPGLGLVKFARHFQLDLAGRRITVSDEIESSKEHVFTEFLHSDTAVASRGGKAYEIRAGRTSMPFRWQSPADASARIEPNVVTAAGAPGSVSSGKQEQRGERVAVSTARAAKTAAFRWELTLPPLLIRD
jgi:hypothetical protein